MNRRDSTEMLGLVTYDPPGMPEVEIVTRSALESYAYAVACILQGMNTGYETPYVRKIMGRLP